MAELESDVWLGRPYCTNAHMVVSLVVEDQFMFGVHFVPMQNVIWLHFNKMSMTPITGIYWNNTHYHGLMDCRF